MCLSLNTFCTGSHVSLFGQLVRNRPTGGTGEILLLLCMPGLFAPVGVCLSDGGGCVRVFL